MRPSERVPFVRQIRLPEIGEAGQERLSSARVALGGASPLAKAIERTYLERAGVTVVDEGEAAAIDPELLGLHHASDVGEGALRALVAMRRILGVGS